MATTSAPSPTHDAPYRGLRVLDGLVRSGAVRQAKGDDA
jgi:hypothetical protein